jgi:hypothetical protein
LRRNDGAKEPRILFVGDSQMRGTYRLHPLDGLGPQIAHRLGLQHSYSVQALGGTGWNTASGNNPAWSHANRVADIVAAAPLSRGAFPYCD